MNSQNVFHVVLVEMAVPLLMPVDFFSTSTPREPRTEREIPSITTGVFSKLGLSRHMRLRRWSVAILATTGRSG